MRSFWWCFSFVEEICDIRPHLGYFLRVRSIWYFFLWWFYWIALWLLVEQIWPFDAVAQLEEVLLDPISIKLQLDWPDVARLLCKESLQIYEVLIKVFGGLLSRTHIPWLHVFVLIYTHMIFDTSLQVVCVEVRDGGIAICFTTLVCFYDLCLILIVHKFPHSLFFSESTSNLQVLLPFEVLN